MLSARGFQWRAALERTRAMQAGMRGGGQAGRQAGPRPSQPCLPRRPPWLPRLPLHSAAAARRPPAAVQFERTLIVAEEGAFVSYLEGCTAPAYDENQLHAAVVELSAAKDAEIKYSTVQNWCARRPGGGQQRIATAAAAAGRLASGCVLPAGDQGRSCAAVWRRCSAGPPPAASRTACPRLRPAGRRYQLCAPPAQASPLPSLPPSRSLLAGTPATSRAAAASTTL